MMKIISIWEPWATLIVHGHKFIETRGWPAPKTIVKETIGIAATKNILPAQRAAYEEPEFQRHYQATGLPPLEELPRGCILGTAFLNSCDPITEDDLDDLTDEELAFGWFHVGRFAWRLRYPRVFEKPIPARGAQGLWEYPKGGEIITFPQRIKAEELHGGAGQEGTPDLRRDLHAV